ncbi:MAG: hypothetical protein ACXVB1_03875 [Pseudobdellovibrionaceae bacterium]
MRNSSHDAFNIRNFILILFAAFGFGESSEAATVNAASCSQADVSNAISSAAVGDTVQVPAGSCSWSGLGVNKAIQLKGSGVGNTNITLTGENTITKQPNGIIRMSDFSFSKSGGGTESKGFYIDGSWLNAEPIVIQNNAFTISSSGLFRIQPSGGVIIAGNSFTGGWDDSFIQPKNDQDTDNSWGTADTLGMRDSTGKKNLYIENNTFYGGTNQGIDCDGGSRCVYRYNTLTYSSFNSHGKDTGPYSMRHFEIYNNNFQYPGGTDQIAAQNWMIWIRGGTGVIFNNRLDDITGYWGDKAEIRLSIRGAEDVRPQGSCSDVSYPVPQQLGQNHNGSSYFTDPIYIWNNSSAAVISDGWAWGNPCGFTWSTFFQWGRDAMNGTAKPGYAAYTYPHPLVNSAAVNPIVLAAPTNLHVVP